MLAKGHLVVSPIAIHSIKNIAPGNYGCSDELSVAVIKVLKVRIIRKGQEVVGIITSKCHQPCSHFVSDVSEDMVVKGVANTWLTG